MAGVIGGLVNIVATSVVASGGTANLDASTGRITMSSVPVLNINGIFSSTYDNYLINYDFRSSSNGSTLTTVLRTGSPGSDVITNYWWRNDIYYNGLQSYNENTTTAATSITLCTTGDYATNAQIYVISPNINERTVLYSSTVTQVNGSIDSSIVYSVGHHNANSINTGITFTISGGSMSGEVSVYGFKE